MSEPEDDVVSYTRPCGHCGGTGKITSDATLDQIATEAAEDHQPPTDAEQVGKLERQLALAREGLEDVATERMWDSGGQQNLRQKASATLAKMDADLPNIEDEPWCPACRRTTSGRRRD